jgi:hypothetical protein
MADIKVTIGNTSKKTVQIIPFNDKDKIIAKQLEDVLNHVLYTDEDAGNSLRRLI